MARTARPGRVEWIGLRSARRAKMSVPERAWLGPDGLDGDHAPGGKRALTLIQAEHLPVVAELLGRAEVPPDLLRRNLVVSGLNLLGFRNSGLRVGEATILVTGPCPPCSRMEETLGFGGYTAMRGHGGVYAEVEAPGEVALGAIVEPVAD